MLTQAQLSLLDIVTFTVAWIVIGAVLTIINRLKGNDNKFVFFGFVTIVITVWFVGLLLAFMFGVFDG